MMLEEQEGIWKETVIAQWKYYLGICLYDNTKKPQDNWCRSSHIQTEDLPNSRIVELPLYKPAIWMQVKWT
jgi:hypothetical protein